MPHPPWEVLVRFSKILLYERPYSVTGTIKLTGLKEAPKDICRAKIIGTWKAENMEEIQFLWSIDKEKWKTITYLNLGESEATVPLKQW